MKKLQNKGFTLVELLVVLVVITLVGVYGAREYKKYMLEQYYKAQVERLNETGSLIQSAAYQMSVPNSLEDMIANGYDFSCEAGGNAGSCPHINKTFWGEKITLESGSDNKVHSLLVPMTKLSERERYLFIGMASKELPHLSVNGTTLKISYSLLANKAWKINESEGGGGGDFNGDLYIPVDGSKQLTDHWVVGDKNITGLEDIVLKYDDGAKQLSVHNGLVRESGTVLSGESVPKPICTKRDTEAKVLTWFNGIAPSDLSSDQFTSISSVYARPIDNGDSWTLWTSFTALSVTSDQYEIYNDYSLRTDPSAKKSSVLMGYITMCRFKNRQL